MYFPAKITIVSNDIIALFIGGYIADKNIKFHIIHFNGDEMILRDKSQMTKIFILLEILKGKRKLKDIANSVGITVQGVSEYMKILERDELIKNGEITLSGLEFITQSLEDIGEFLQYANKLVGKTKIVEAIAGEDIKKGDKVGLFMENGYIHAYKKESSSTGIAIHNAKKGEDVGVGNLKGIIKINYGEIVVYPMPSIEDGGSRKVNTEKIRKIIDKNKKIGVCGVVPYIILTNLADIDFEFSAVNATIDAYYRGISSQLFVSHEMLPHILSILAERGVNYRVESIQ